jgi:hypothetical protein
MDIALLSLLFFILITILYYTFPGITGKPVLTLDMLQESNNVYLDDFYNKHMKSLAFYLGFVVVSQLCLNVAYLMSKCGGALDQNIGSAALYTFIPWILIFGVMLAVLLVFPGFKNAFSDVIGYYVVAGGANEIFGQILLGTDINQDIERETDLTKKKELTQAAEAIIKICGNKSILINQINPENFMQIWDTLKPLMTAGSYESTDIKQQLLDLVVLKDNIGEAFWYVYTAILISSIVYYNLATRGCVKSVDQIKADHDNYIKTKEEADKQTERNNETTYHL